MKSRLNLVLGKNATRPAPVAVDESEEEVVPANWGKEVSDFREKVSTASPSADSVDTLSYFASLAEED